MTDLTQSRVTILDVNDELVEHLCGNPAGGRLVTLAPTSAQV